MEQTENTNQEIRIGSYFTSLKNDKILPAFQKALSEIESAIKDSDNPFHKSKYADLASCMKAINPALHNNKLSLGQAPTLAEDARSVSINTTVFHESGQYIRWEFALPFGTTVNAQEVGKAITFARRYGLAGVGLITDEDDDANEVSGKTDGKPVNRQTSNQPKAQPKQEAKPEPKPQEKAQEPANKPNTSNGAITKAVADVAAKNNAPINAVDKFLSSTGVYGQDEEQILRFIRLYGENKAYSRVAQKWKATGNTFAECLDQAEMDGPDNLPWTKIG